MKDIPEQVLYNSKGIALPFKQMRAEYTRSINSNLFGPLVGIFYCEFV